MITIEQLSIQLGTSKMTIYNKLKILESKLKDHVSKENNITFIDDIGANLIKNSINPKKFKRDATLKNIQDKRLEDNKDVFKVKYIETLEKQLEAKDKQIEALTEAITNSQKFQMLLENKVQMLEQGKQEQQEQTKVTITPEPEQQQDNKLMDSIKQLHDKINSIESHNNESIKQFQDKTIELESGINKKEIVNDELLTTLKQLQEKLNSIETEKKKKFKWKFWNN